MEENNELGPFEAIWSFVMGSLRLILFLVTFVLTFVALGLAIFINLTLKYNQAGWSEYLVWNICVLVPLLVVFFGAYGTFYSHEGSLKTFSLILTSIALSILIGTGLLLMFGDRLLIRDDVVESLQSVQNKYDWLKSPTDPNAASFADTIVWDSLQSSFGCCGVTGAQDWDSLRPAGEPAPVTAPAMAEAAAPSAELAKTSLPAPAPPLESPQVDRANNSISLPSPSPLVASFYPRSCCDAPSIALKGYEQTMCSAQDTYTIGCHSVLRRLWKWALVIPGILAAFHLLVALVAHLIRRQIKNERLASEGDDDVPESAVGVSVALQAY